MVQKRNLGFVYFDFGVKYDPDLLLTGFISFTHISAKPSLTQKQRRLQISLHKEVIIQNLGHLCVC